tara:strand:- start:82 stop:543 length:462 start_codon:yes stop_codon:yes gene_type:complete
MLAFSPLGAASAEPSKDIYIGQIFGNEQGQVINGWKHNGGGLYQSRTYMNSVTTEKSICCYATFEKDETILIARTEAVARKDSGGVLAERVLATMLLKPLKTEIGIDCSLLWITPVLSFYDEKTELIRSVVISGDDFVTITWSDPGFYCDHGD